MARFGIQGTYYFGPQDATAGAGPVITGTTPTTPYPEETGVVINGTGFGATQGTGGVTYNGTSLAVTNWTDTAITVTWPALADASTMGFNTNLALIVSIDGGTPSAPFNVQTIPDPTYQYVLIGTKDPGLGAGEGLFDDDTLGVGDTYVYGIESPAGGWDFSGLANHYINAVTDGGTFTYRLWDEALGQWSNEAVESYTVTGPQLGSGNFAGSSAVQADGRVVQFGSGAFAGSAAIQGDGRLVTGASGSFAGNSVFQADGLLGKFASGSFAGNSAFQANGLLGKFASGSFAGTSAVSANGRRIKRGAGSFAGTATMQADGRVSTGTSGSFAGSSTFQADGRLIRVYRDNADFAASSAFQADGRVGGAQPGSGTFTGTAAFAAAGRQLFRSSGVFAGSSIWSGNGIIPSQTIGPIDKPGLQSGSPQAGLVSKSPQRGVIGSQGGL